MNPKISVIMPMYNVEKYVSLAIQSLLNQTFTDFEAIFVDDCGPDNSLEIAKSFNDPRIKIIQNENNLGATGSRNRGIEIAKGDYIYFLDSDDAMLPNCLELLYSTAVQESEKADMVSSVISMYAIDSEFQSIENIKVQVINNGEMNVVSNDLKVRLWEEYVKHKIHCAVWLSLFNRSLFDGSKAKIRFRDFAIADDDFFLCEILCAASNIKKINTPVYVYRQRQGSISNSSDNNRLKKYIPAIINGANFLEDKLLSMTNDVNFTNKVICFVVARLMNVFVLPFFRSNEFMAMEKIEESLRENSKDKINFFKSLIYYDMLLKISR